MTGQHVGAAVCIFDTYLPVGATQAQFLNDQSPSQQPRGLARLVQLNADLCLLDVTVQGLTPGLHTLAIHENGNLSRGALSCGERYTTTADNEAGTLGDIHVGANGWGDLVVETRRFSVHDVIGRSMVVAPATATPSGTGSLCGIIARSAGLFANMKKVCACSGRTLWEEARMQEQAQL